MDAWERVREVAPGANQHAARRRRETAVANDLEECERETTAGGVTREDNVRRLHGPVRCTRWGTDEEEI